MVHSSCTSMVNKHRKDLVLDVTDKINSAGYLHHDDYCVECGHVD
jgi:hypothetical protein